MIHRDVKPANILLSNGEPPVVDFGGVAWGDDGYIHYDGHLEGDGIAESGWLGTGVGLLHPSQRSTSG